MVARQQAAGGKGQELAAVAVLLERLSLLGQVVTRDAQYAQRGLSRQFVAKRGGYFWVVKLMRTGVRFARGLRRM